MCINICKLNADYLWEARAACSGINELQQPCIFSFHSFAELALSAMSGTSDEELNLSHDAVLLLFFQSTLSGSYITQFYLLNGSIRPPLQSVPVDGSIFRSSLHQP